MTDMTNNTRNSSTAFMMGMAIGALAAVLFAPKRGQDLRDDISDKANEMRNKVRSATTKVEDDVEKTIDKAKSKINNEVNEPTEG